MLNNRIVTACTVAVSCMLASAATAAVSIDFSTDGAGNPLAPGATIANQYTSLGVTFIGSAFADPADPLNPFATNTDMTLVAAGGNVPPGASFPAGAGNFLHGYAGYLLEDGDSNFAITFDTLITTFSMDVYDDRVGLTQLFAFKGDNIVDLTQVATDPTAAPQRISVDFAAGFDGVGVVLGSNVDWVAVDNLSFAFVPEPASMLAIGALGAVTLRRSHRPSITQSSHPSLPSKNRRRRASCASAL
jgi:hypothetical protein